MSDDRSRPGPVTTATVTVIALVAGLLRRAIARFRRRDDPPPHATADGPDPADVDRDDLLRAARAGDLQVTQLRRIDNGDGSEQLLAIGSTPSASAFSVAALFLASGTCAVAFAVLYALDGNRALMGGLLGAALVGLGVGLITWSKRLLPDTLSIEERADLDQGHAAALEEDLSRPELAQPGRRLLLGSLLGAGGAFAVAMVFPLRSLGPKPGKALATTSWQAGTRLVRDDGTPVHRDDIPVDASLTVFPEGHTGDGDAQVMLLRVPDGLLSPPTAAGAVGGRVAYSKVCTHAGCPVAQFRVDSRAPDTSYELLCPCHQSLFDVLDGARPLAGPAASALPQLPMAVDAGGYLVATGDFPRPIGPSYWNEP